MGRRRAGWLVALLGALPARAASGAGDAFGSASIPWEEGARAPADTWLQDDGCPARTGATETRPWSGAREVAWRFATAGDVEGEPVAWMGRTVVVERAGTKHVVHVLSTATGAERYKTAFDSSVTAAPCIGDGRIVLRTSSRTVQGFAFGDKALVPRWSVTAKTAIGPPTVLRDEVFVVVDGVLQRRTYGSSEVAWPKAGATGVDAGGAAAGKGSAGEVARPSVRGGSVFVAFGRKLVEVDRRDGSSRRQADLPAPADPRAPRVVVGYGDVLVPCGAKIPGDEDGGDTARFARPDEGAFEEKPSLALPYGVASLGRDWAGVFGKKGVPVLVLLNAIETDTREDEFLATPSVHAEFLESKCPPTAQGEIVSIAGRAFDGGTLEVVRLDGVPAVARAIPLRDRLLVVETRNRVTAWKSAAKAPAVAPLDLLAAADPAAAPLPAAHALVEDGRIVSGGFSVDGKSATLRGSGKPGDAGSWPLASVRALLSDESPRRLLYASRPDDAAAGVAAIGRASAGADLAALVAKAVEAGDADLARRVHTAASERGGPEADLERAEKAVAALEAKGGSRVEDAACEVEERLKALLSREPDVLVEAASSLPADAPRGYATTLVRAAVARSRYHSGATEWVRTHLPPGIEPRGFQDLADWLDFLDIQAATTMRVYAPGKKLGADVPQAVREALEANRKAWREDLAGFQNGPLLVLSPPERPGTIAKCLTLGRIVCDALDAAFASVGKPRAEEEVLVLQLFPNQAEYLARSHDTEPGHGFGHLEKTAGHYDPSANVTRIYFPEAEGRDSVTGVYTHELTHHWIARRRPVRAEGETLEDHAGGPGYWIVEGFADFVRGFDYDVLAVKADPQNARAEYADVVAGTPEAALVPWPALLTMPQHEAYALDDGNEKPARSVQRWRMGVGHPHGKINLYYAQAAATTAYLFLADGGKYRSALLSYVYDHYAGSPDVEALLKSLGVTGEELGSRIVKWCRTVVTSAK